MSFPQGTLAIGVALIVVGLLANPWIIGHLAGDGDLESSLFRGLILAFDAGCIVLGAFLAIRRPRLPWVEMATALAALASVLVMAEIALTLTDYTPLRYWPRAVPELASWWSYDGERLHVVRENMPDEEERHRHNAAGYRDVDELDFATAAAAGDKHRVLLLGDSFAYGASAWGEGESFAELLEDEDTVVWNTGIPGHGQRDQLLILDRYLGVIEPDVVVLALYMNDFYDNAYPPGKMHIFSDQKSLIRYRLEKDGTARLLDPEATYRRAFPPASGADFLLVSRVGSLVARGVARLEATLHARRQGPKPEPSSNTADDPRVKTTRQLLSEIQERAIRTGASLVLLIIPSRADVESVEPTFYYNATLGLCSDLSLDCLEVREALEPTDYDHSHPLDSHWTPDGHRKAAALLSARLETPTRGTAGIVVVEGNQTVLPSIGKNGSLFADAMRVITESFVKR